MLPGKKIIKIGIPQGLFYWQHFPFWKNFFEGLGTEVVVSEKTNEKMLTQGIERLTSELCLPIKAFCSQILSLKGKCDFIFIPSIYSLEKKIYNCPKLIGLPDLMKAAVPEVSILDFDLNFERPKRDFYLSLWRLGLRFRKNPFLIKRAIEKAERSKEKFLFSKKEGKVSIALISHPYLIYDENLNHRIINRLEKMGARLLFPEMIERKKQREFLYHIVDRPYWTCEDEILGAGAYFIEKGNIDGLILLSAFGCGPDSVMTELLKNHAKKFKKPFLEIALDEHMAEAGMVTRLEAFFDTLSFKERKSSIFIEKIPLKTISSKIKVLGMPYVGGRSKIFRKILKENFNITLISPPVTEKTISLGVKYSPEWICFPFKIILGTFIECLKQGADTLLITTSFNACRMGRYALVQERILKNLGYKFQFFKIHGKDKTILGAIKTLKSFFGSLSLKDILSLFKLGVAKLRILDRLEREVQKIRAIEIEKGKGDQIYQEAIDAIDEAESIEDLNKIFKLFQEKLKKIPQKKNFIPLKIGLIGELYVLVEPFANQEIEKELGKMGVEVERVNSTYFSEYTKLFPSLRFDPLTREKRKLKKFTKKYLKRDVGGHGLESLGKKISWAKKFDGLIHLMPFGCLPEIIAQNIMLKVKSDIPVLTIPCDEQLGKAGLITRLEAFIDLIKNKKYENLSWN